MSMSPAQRGRFDPFPKATSPGWAGGAAARQPIEKQRKRERLLRPCWVRGAGSPLGRAAPAHSPRRQPREAFQASQCHAGLAFVSQRDVGHPAGHRQGATATWLLAPSPGARWGAAGTLCVCVPTARQRGSVWVAQTRGAWAAPTPLPGSSRSPLALPALPESGCQSSPRCLSAYLQSSNPRRNNSPSQRLFNISAL